MPRILQIPQPANYLQLPAYERRQVVSDLGAVVRRAQTAGCLVERQGTEVVITVPDGVVFDLRGLR